MEKYIKGQLCNDIKYYRKYIVYLYPNIVQTTINGKTYIPMASYFDGKKMNEWDIHELFIACLGLNSLAITQDRIDDRRNIAGKIKIVIIWRRILKLNAFKKYKNIIDGIVFLGVLLGLIVISSKLIKPKDYDAYDLSVVKLRTEAIKGETKESMDVIFAGNSESCYTFSPLQLWGEHGIVSYDLGSGAQRLCDTYAILKEMFKTQSPKVLVLETDSVMEEYPGIHKDDDKFTNKLEDVFPIFHYHSAYNQIQLPQFILKYTQNRKNEQLYKGFQLRNEQAGTENFDYMAVYDGQADIQISSDGVDILKDIKKLCQTNDCELVLVSAPSMVNWNMGKHNAVKAWSESENVEYIDLNLCNDEIGIDWTEDTFDNGVHVNINGAYKVNEYIGSILKSKVGSSEKEETVVESWNRDYSESIYNIKER